MKSIIYKGNNRLFLLLAEITSELLLLCKNKYFYIGIITLFVGIELNFYSQEYLLHYMQNGRSLPVLSDLILDNIPLWHINFLYDIFSLVSLFVIIIYIVHKREYKKIPYFILLSGIFQIVRGFFIVLTPFGNPMGFNGTEGPFYGFSNVELGVYPSGHIGISFLYFLLIKDTKYKRILLFCVAVIAFTLFLSHGHYTIDILSGIFFAYAIKSYGDKHLLKFVVPEYSEKKVYLKNEIKTFEELMNEELQPFKNNEYIIKKNQN